MTLQNFQVYFNGKPTAQHYRDLASHKQARMIWSVANTKRVFAEPLCVRALGCKPDELNRQAASAFIDALNRLEPIAAGTFWQQWEAINS